MVRGQAKFLTVEQVPDLPFFEQCRWRTYLIEHTTLLSNTPQEAGSQTRPYNSPR